MGLLIKVKDASVDAASRVSIRITVAVIDSFLESWDVPSVVEVGVVTVPSRIAVRVNKWLRWVHGLAADRVEVVGCPVNLRARQRLFETVLYDILPP